MSEDPVDIPDPEAVQIHFLRALPRIRNHAEFKFRKLAPEAKDDAVQKALGLAWKYYAREASKGKEPDEYISVIADFAVRHVRDGRDVTGIEKAKDVLSGRARKHKGFTVEALPEIDTAEHVGEGMEAMRERRETPPDEAAAFHHDFPVLVDSLPERQAAVALDAAIGDTTTELAEKHGISAGRVSQIRTVVRDKWAELCTPKSDRDGPAR